MSGILCALVGGGGSRLLTVGTTVISTITYWGFNTLIPIGSLSPTEFLSSNIFEIQWTSNNILLLGVTNGSQTNTGWTSISINGTVFLRTSATFSGGVWQWTGVSNPIGTTAGAIIPVDIG